MFLLGGCSQQQLKSLSNGLMAASGGTYVAPVTRPQKIMFFGGKNNQVYLGCWSCTRYEKDSVFNSYGDYGSEYRNESLFNSYSDYGSDYSNYSACNSYANKPPVIVDSNGNFYGYLTLNKYKNQTYNQDILTWLVALCAD